MGKPGISIAAVGDALAVKPLCREDSSLQKLREELLRFDVRIMNLETSIHEYEEGIYPSPVSGGDWVAAPPAVLDDLMWLGFNTASCANNHSLDFLHAGLLKTIENLKKSGIAFCGVGASLFAASRPCYLETKGGRVAVISLNTTFLDWHMAGDARRDFSGRPGVNGVGFHKVHHIDADALRALARIAEATEVNQKLKGQESGAFRFGAEVFQEGEGGTTSDVDSAAFARLERSIKEARRQADVVLISCHSHERRGADMHTPCDFQLKLARGCIDAGAHAYFGHGPHVLRGVEVYRGAPIFHGLGDFFYQCELLDRAPNEFYRAFGELGPEACTADGYDHRLSIGGRFGELNPHYFMGAIGSVELWDGALVSASLRPVELNFDARRPLKGTPKLAEEETALRILSDIERYSKPFGTELLISGDTAAIRLL